MKDKLGNHIQQIRGVSYKPSDLSETLMDGYTTLLRANNIVDGKINLDSVQYVKKDRVSQMQILNTNDILICSSSGSLSSIGKSAIYKKSGEHTFGAFCKVIRTTGKLYSNYLALYLRSPFYRHHIEKVANGANINNLRNEDLDEIILEIPTEAKQHAIISNMEKLQSIIESRRIQLRKLDELVKCRFVEMFGDPLGNKCAWQSSIFGAEFDIYSGGTPKTNVAEYWDGGTIPWIGSNMCQNNVLETNDGKFITEKGLKESSAKWAHSGFVLVALVGATIGKTALLRFSSTTNQNVASINVPGNPAYTPEYIYMCMQMLYRRFIELGDGGFKMANLSFIRQLPLMTPPIKLQKRFSSFVQQLDKSKFSLHFVQRGLRAMQKLEILES